MQKVSAKQNKDVNAKMYTSGEFKTIIDDCNGCERIIEVKSSKYCKSYVNPGAKWKLGICNFATHKKPEITAVKIRVNPLKAAKRASAIQS